MLVKQGQLHYNGYRIKSGPAPEQQHKGVFYRRKTLKNELVIVLDFGGQYNQLVSRRVRECNVYCEIYSYKTDIQKIKEMNPKGIILHRGQNSCYTPGSLHYQDE